MSTPSSNKALRAAVASRAPSRTAQRNSGIELLKLLAMFLIVIFHTVQTLSAESDAVDFSDYVFRFAEASSDPRVPILAMFFYFGTLGNTVFFVCTAWFLLDRERNSKERAVRMLADIWVISVSILLIVLALRRGDLGGTLILKSLFPTLFSLNWYLTCYLLFYLIHPFLNQLIRGMSQRTLFRVAVLMFLLYSVCDLLHAFLNNYFTVSFRPDPFHLSHPRKPAAAQPVPSRDLAVSVHALRVFAADPAGPPPLRCHLPLLHSGEHAVLPHAAQACDVDLRQMLALPLREAPGVGGPDPARPIAARDRPPRPRRAPGRGTQLLEKSTCFSQKYLEKVIKMWYNIGSSGSCLFFILLVSCKNSFQGWKCVCGTGSAALPRKELQKLKGERPE